MKVCNLLNLGMVGDTPFYPRDGSHIWTDGENIYYSAWNVQKQLIKGTNVWIDKIWENMRQYGTDNYFDGRYIWTDGTNIYYCGSKKLNIGTNVWSDVTFEGIPNNFSGDSWPDCIWILDDDCYFSAYTYNSATQKIDMPVMKKLNKNTRIWSDVTWNGFNVNIGERLYGSHVWNDNNNIYCSGWESVEDVATLKVLNNGTNNWSDKTWYGVDDIDWSGQLIWHDGSHTYMSLGDSGGDVIQKELNSSTSTWTNKEWRNINRRYEFPDGTWAWLGLNPHSIWTDGIDIYYSQDTSYYPEGYKDLGQRRLNRQTSDWEEIQWYTISS